MVAFELREGGRKAVEVTANGELMEMEQGMLKMYVWPLKAARGCIRPEKFFEEMPATYRLHSFVCSQDNVKFHNII